MNNPHFLLATDLMSGSHKVALKAKELTQKLSGILSIVHVVELPRLTHYAQSLNCSDQLDLILGNARSIILTISEELNIPIERQHVVDGNAAELITKLAQTLNVDAIIIGSHNGSTIASILGSTANSILHKAKCDVFTFKIDKAGVITDDE